MRRIIAKRPAAPGAQPLRPRSHPPKKARLSGDFPVAALRRTRENRSMIKPSRLLIVAAAGLGLFAWTVRPVRLCRGFLPDNTMRIPVSPFQISSGLDQAGFNRVLARVQALYGPIVAAHGGHLVINRLWDDPTVNASANRSWIW